MSRVRKLVESLSRLVESGAFEFGEPTRDTPSEPGFYYHATNQERARDIARAGKIVVRGPSWGTDQNVWPDGATEKRAYFSPKANVVWQFAPEEGRPAIIRVPVGAAKFRRESTSDVYSTKPVPTTNAEVMAKDGTWHPLSILKR